MPIQGTPISPPADVPLTFPALVTVAEAESYFNTRMKSESWDYSDLETKQKAIYAATRALNSLSYKGTIVDATQDNKFPRNEYGTPDKIKWACCEEILSLLNGNEPNKDLMDLHVKSSTVVGFSTTVNEYVERPWVLVGITSPIAWKYIAPYLVDFRTVHIERV